jgi:hypothetical protein
MAHGVGGPDQSGVRIPPPTFYAAGFVSGIALELRSRSRRCRSPSLYWPGAAGERALTLPRHEIRAVPARDSAGDPEQLLAGQVRRLRESGEAVLVGKDPVRLPALHQPDWSRPAR